MTYTAAAGRVSSAGATGSTGFAQQRTGLPANTRCPGTTKIPTGGPTSNADTTSASTTGSTRTAQRQAQTHYAVPQKLQGQRQAAQRPSQTQQAIKEQKTSRTSNQGATGASSTSARSARPRAQTQPSGLIILRNQSQLGLAA